MNVRGVEPMKRPDRLAQLAGLGLDLIPVGKKTVVVAKGSKDIKGSQFNLSNDPAALYNQIMLGRHSVSKKHPRPRA